MPTQPESKTPRTENRHSFYRYRNPENGLVYDSPLPAGGAKSEPIEYVQKSIVLQLETELAAERVRADAAEKERDAERIERSLKWSKTVDEIAAQRDTALADRAAMRETIERAPHDHCAFGIHQSYACNCWKSRALQPNAGAELLKDREHLRTILKNWIDASLDLCMTSPAEVWIAFHAAFKDARAAINQARTTREKA